MSAVAVAYVAYLLISVGVTVLVGRTLHRHGRLFIINCVHGDVSLADRVNDLLLVGFYLVNIAFVLLLTRARGVPGDWAAATFLLTGKLGIVLTSLGVMHFLNIAVLLAVRNRKH